MELIQNKSKIIHQMGLQCCYNCKYMAFQEPDEDYTPDTSIGICTASANKLVASEFTAPRYPEVLFSDICRFFLQQTYMAGNGCPYTVLQVEEIDSAARKEMDKWKTPIE